MTRSISYVGHRMERPECVLTTKAGDIFCSHKRFGVARICADGSQYALAQPTEIGGLPILANGIALRDDGSFLVANISDAGGLLELDADGVRLLHPCSKTDQSPPVNFVTVDDLGKVWITVSSTFSPRSLAYNRQTANGYVAVIENGEMKVVVENLAYTNECRLDYEGGWLYVAETMGQRISRIRLDEKGVHGKVELYATMPRGAFVDGIEIDSEGAVLAACIISSELIRVAPDGSQEVIVGERDDAWVDDVEAVFDAGDMGRPQLDTSPTKKLKNIASLAYRNETLDQIVCGNLLDNKLPVFEAPVSGRPPVHWNVDVPIYGEAF
ncbi:SMP-30/gluconolactonase/LRE family protein [Pseudahrensia aquimaris]|uniref:SMP-30/gluconolactonase/LRE family protein n=1 Tax=Pseudahrensia aquimaris TaxID=744461 RepID=A0ABW3FF96_9HYPH